MYIILIYDIKQISNYQKRQRKIFKICKKYLVHIQNSVFEGELTDPQYKKLCYELKEILLHNEDSCIIFKSRNQKWLDKIFLTEKVDSNSTYI